MSQPIKGQGGHLVFPISPKNTKLVEDIEILLPVKFRWIPFSGFRGEVEKVSAYQRPGRPSCFSDRPEKHKLGRGQWDLASCTVSLNSDQQFQRRSRKCLSQSEARAAILFIWSARSIQLFQRRSNMSQQIRGQDSQLCRLEKHSLCRGRWVLASRQVSLKTIQRLNRGLDHNHVMDISPAWQYSSRSYSKTSLRSDSFKQGAGNISRLAKYTKVKVTFWSHKTWSNRNIKTTKVWRLIQYIQHTWKVLLNTIKMYVN